MLFVQLFGKSWNSLQCPALHIQKHPAPIPEIPKKFDLDIEIHSEAADLGGDTSGSVLF